MTGPGEHRPHLPPVVVGLLTAGPLWGGYLLLQYPPPPVELIVGAGAAVIAATTWAVAHTLLWPGYRIKLAVLADMLRLPWQITRDFAVVSALLFAAARRRRRLSGSVRWAPFDTSADEASVRGSKMMTAVLQSAAPNTVLLGFDTERARMLVHELKPAGPVEPAVEQGSRP